MELVTRQLSAFARGLRAGDLPAEVKHQAKRTLLNYFGCACGGAGHESVEAALAGRGPGCGGGAAVVIGRAERCDLPGAALLNGMSSAVYSFDDTHAQALVHPGGPVASSLLALASAVPVSGARFFLAFILGAEVVCRLSKAISVPPAQAKPEWVQTGICAGIGGAFGAAWLLDLSEAEITSAVGIAATRASGLRGLSRSMCFSYMAGAAAEAGLSAAFLAQAGLRGPAEPLAAAQGFCAAFSEESHLPYLTAGLGETYELAANTFKPYPCGVVIHPAIDACLALAERLPRVGEVKEILVGIRPEAEALCNIPQPEDQFEGQVSLQHWVACALLDHEAGVAQCMEARLHAADVAALRQQVRLVPDAGLARSAAWVRIVLQSGEALQEVVEACRGSASRPLSDAELEAKYMKQAVPRLGDEAAQRLAAACWDIEAHSEIATIMNLASAGV